MFLDILVSTLVAIVVGTMTGDVNLQLVLLSIIAGLAMDLDFIIWNIRHSWVQDRYSHEHRDLFHVPLIYTGLGTIICFYVLGPVMALTWFVSSTWHFIHDTFDGGWGIKWLYPIHKGYWLYVPYSNKRYFKNRAEQRAYAQIHGSDNWIKYEIKKSGIYILYFIISILLLLLAA